MIETTTGFPLSPQQDRLWHLLEGVGDRQPFRVAAAVAIEGELDPAALEQAAHDIVARHEILHTAFRYLPGISTPLQVIVDPPRLTLPVEDLSKLGSEAFEARAREHFAELLKRPFDLESGQCLALSLLRRGPRHWRLLAAMPALCADVRTLDAFLAQLAQALATRSSTAEEEPIQYAAIADFLNEVLDSEEAADGRRYWAEQDLSAAGSASLPGADKEAADGKFRPRSLEVELASETVARLMALGSPEASVLAAWAALIHRLSGAHRIVIGHQADGRGDEELEHTFGPLSRLVPVVLEVTSATGLGELAAVAGDKLAEAEAWQECFVGLGENDPTFLPHGFAFGPATSRFVADELELRVLHRHAVSERFHLALAAVETTAPGGEPGLELRLYHDPAVHDEAQAHRLAERFGVLLSDAVEHPEKRVGELEILPPEERTVLVEAFNATERTFDDQSCLHRMFEHQVDRTPERAALSFEGESLTYAELDRRANQLAHRLRSLGVEPEVRVGICLDRGLEMIVGLLGILKAGGAYLPLDPEYPAERLRFMIEDAAASLILTTAAAAAALPQLELPILRLDEERQSLAAEPTGRLPGLVTLDHLAYVIYTSGSTGRPKGVMISHRSIGNRLLFTRHEFQVDAEDVLLQKTSFSFDASVWEIFVPLFAGARLVLARPDGHKDAAYMVETIRREKITLFQLVPSMLRVVLEEPDFGRCESLRVVFSGGEALTAEMRNRFYELLNEAELCNLYGPTEASIDGTSHLCRRGQAADVLEDVVPIGRPLPNQQAYLLDDGCRPVPAGISAELHLGGVGLARGYFGRPALTAERFVPHPSSAHPGQRLYRTGDLARQRPDGTLDYLGRIDHQYKVRGYRIELGEIEALLAGHPGVREAAVAVEDGARLRAFVVPRETPPESGGAAESLVELPNGLLIHQLNRGETNWLYEEIFTENTYLKNGIRLPEDACIFDVGANIGLFTLFAKIRFPASRIYSFEPAPPTFAALRDNVERYGFDVELFNIALSEREGEATFTFYPKVSASSGLYADAREDEDVTRAYLANQGADAEAIDELMIDSFASEQFKCRLRSLSDVIREEGVERIDLLKLDVEKSELDVLRGVAEEDWQKIKQCVIEIHDRDGELETARRMLEERGYEVVVEEAAALEGSQLYNLYAIHPTAAPGVSPDPASSLDHLLTVTPEVLRAHLGRRLPEYMLPASFVMLEELPRTPSGKVDRPALPALVPAATAQEPAAARTPVEELVAGICAEILGREQIGPEENFFDQGGHSLLATRAISRLRRAFDVALPLRSLFDAPKIGELAQKVEEALRQKHAVVTPPIEPVERGDRQSFPLSFAQRRLWFFDQLMPQSPVYNVPAAARLRGRLDAAALAAALDEIVRRHEALRTTFAEEDGEPVQRIAPPQPLTLEQVDLGDEPPEKRQKTALRLATEHVLEPFDLRRGPLLRAKLLRLSDDEHVLALALHHIVSDGWSMGVLLEELAVLYAAFAAGRESELPAPGVQYVDYALWQRGWLAGDGLGGQLDYWRSKLAPPLPVLELPTDRPRPETQTFSGAKQILQLSEKLAGELEALARRENATLFMILLALLETLFYRATGQKDQVLGTNVAGRNHAEIESLIGLFLNVLVLRFDVAGNPSFRELLSRTRETTLEAYAHQDLPFDKLVEALAPERDRSRQPFFQIKVDYQDVPPEIFELEGLELEPLELDAGVVHSDLTISVFHSGRQLQLTFEYNRDLYDEGTIATLMADFETLAAAVAEAPDSEIDRLSARLDEAARQRSVATGRKLKESRRPALQKKKRRVVSVEQLAGQVKS